MEVSLSGLHLGMWVAYFKTPGRPLRTQKYETFGPKLPLSVHRFSYADSTRQLLDSFHFCGDPVEWPGHTALEPNPPAWLCLACSS